MIEKNPILILKYDENFSTGEVNTKQNVGLSRKKQLLIHVNHLLNVN